VTAAGQSPPDPGERRLAAYLEEVRENPPPTDEGLARRVRRSARWQHAIRGPLEVVGHLSGALADGLGTLLGGTRRTGR
jgi:hypothetical protein